MTTPSATVLARRYQLIEEIGAGGMAHVYRGRDLLLDREVAVKVLRPDLAADPDVLQRFQQEARRAAGLAHPNVVAVYDVGVDDGSPAAGTDRLPYIVMEFVEGETLKSRVRRGPVPPVQAVQSALQVLSALEAAHRRGIVHRDIKAQNVLVTPEGVVKVTDFGIAAEIGATTAADGPPDRVLATAHYCSPEQAVGRAASPASDVYGVGVVLFELLTGRLPFPGDDADAVLRAQVDRPVPAPRSLNKRIPAALEGIVLRALEKDPAARYPNAEAMATELRRWLSAFAEQTTVLTPVDERRLADNRTRVVSPADRSARGSAVAPVPLEVPARRGANGRANRSQPAPAKAPPGFNWVLVLIGSALFACALASYGGWQLVSRLGGAATALPNPFGEIRLPGGLGQTGTRTASTPTPAPPTPTAPRQPTATPVPPTPARATPPTAPAVVSPALPSPTATATAAPPTATSTRPAATPTPTRPSATPTIPPPPPAAASLKVQRLTSGRVPGGSAKSGDIRGVVVDPTGRPITGLRFRIREESGGWSAEFPSGGNQSTNGTWWFASLSTATYIITATDPVSGASTETVPIRIESPPEFPYHSEVRLEFVLSR